MEKIIFSTANKEDLKEILALQKLCFQKAGELYADEGLPPLTQTLKELEEEASYSVIIKAVKSGHIIGSARAEERKGYCLIKRVIVHPDHENQGLGRALMERIEKEHPFVERYELFTGHKSKKNIAFYEKLGYRIFRTQRVNELLSLVYMGKKGSNQQ